MYNQTTKSYTAKDGSDNWIAEPKPEPAITLKQMSIVLNAYEEEFERIVGLLVAVLQNKAATLVDCSPKEYASMFLKGMISKDAGARAKALKYNSVFVHARYGVLHKGQPTYGMPIPAGKTPHCAQINTTGLRVDIEAKSTGNIYHRAYCYRVAVTKPDTIARAICFNKLPHKHCG
jgi:hypothetical protein